MDQREKRQLENQLLVMGLKGLNDPDLIQQLAELISAWPGDKHDFLRDLLNECDPDKRYEMYHAIAPKLKFKPLSLPQYEAQIAEKAGAMVSQRRMRVEGDRPKPIEVGDKLAEITAKELANAALASLTCHRCGRFEKYLGETPVSAMLEARKAGWIREPGINKECCAQCAAQLAAAEQITLSSQEALIVTDRRRVN